MLSELQHSKLGCHVGDTYTGCVSYADDLVLLAPSLTALKGMIHICENYASKHYIQFNGKKSQLIVFDKKYSHQREPSVCVNGARVEVVQSLKYLGHLLINDRSNSMTEYVRRDFIKKSNAFLCDFKNITSVVKHDLFEKYCYAFYGINLCDFESDDFHILYKDWRKLVRRIWNIPYRSHCDLLPHVAECVPPNVFMPQRFINFFYAGLYCKNDVVRNIFKMSMLSDSRIGNNVRYILSKIGYSVNDIYTLSPAQITKNVLHDWARNVPESDIAKGYQIRELVYKRDSLSKWLLNTHECQMLINVLSTD